MIAKSELISVSVRNQACAGWPGGFTEEEICDRGSDKGVALTEYFRHEEAPTGASIGMRGCNQVTQSLRRHFDLT